jgi:hypothetical protein
MKKRLLTKKDIEVIEKLVNELVKVSQEQVDKCSKEKNYFGAFKNELELNAFKTVSSHARLYVKRKWKI